MLSSGFTNAPITKSALVFIIISSIGVSIADIKYLFYIQIFPQIWKYQQLWRLLIWPFCYTNSTEVLQAGMVLYNLRVIERLWGSRKFGSFILSTLPFTTLLPPVILAIFVRPLSLYTLNYLPAGPTAILFAILAQYHAAIPTTYKYRIATSSPPSSSGPASASSSSSSSSPISPPASVTFSDKSMVYFLAFQLSLSQLPHSILPAFIGWAIGYAWRAELMPARIYSWRVPGWVYGDSRRGRPGVVGGRGGAAGAGTGFGATTGTDTERYEGLRRRLEGESRAAAAATATATGESDGGRRSSSGGVDERRPEQERPLAGQILDRFRGAF